MYNRPSCRYAVSRFGMKYYIILIIMSYSLFYIYLFRYITLLNYHHICSFIHHLTHYFIHYLIHYFYHLMEKFYYCLYQLANFILPLYYFNIIFRIKYRLSVYLLYYNLKNMKGI